MGELHGAGVGRGEAGAVGSAAGCEAEDDCVAGSEAEDELCIAWATTEACVASLAEEDGFFLLGLGGSAGAVAATLFGGGESGASATLGVVEGGLGMGEGGYSSADAEEVGG